MKPFTVAAAGVALSLAAYIAVGVAANAAPANSVFPSNRELSCVLKYHGEELNAMQHYLDGEGEKLLAVLTTRDRIVYEVAKRYVLDVKIDYMQLYTSYAAASDKRCHK